MKLQPNRTVAYVISTALVFLFTYTAFHKLFRSEGFEEILQHGLSSEVATVLKVVVPLSELAVAVLLFVPQSRMLGLYAAMGLLTAYNSLIAYYLMFTTGLPCSCGSVFKLSWEQHLWLNMFLVCASAVALWLSVANAPKKFRRLYN